MSLQIPTAAAHPVPGIGGMMLSPAAAAAAPQFQPESFRFYDSSAIVEIVSRSPDLSRLNPQTDEDLREVQQYRHLADNVFTPLITNWLYPFIGLISCPQHEIDKAHRDVIANIQVLEESLLNRTHLLTSGFGVADIVLALTLFPAFKNLFDQDVVRRFPATTKWFIGCVNNRHVQYVYDRLQVSQVSYEPKREARKRKVTVDDYQIIKVLGKGCMGKVLLVRHKKSSNLYALKSISKSSVIVHKELNHTLAERRILSTISQVKHPFLIQCHNAFTSENELFLVLDFVAGGDMATQLAKFGRFPIQRVQFYAAEIVLGVLELHRLGVIYRDLKPENILLQPDGHILLTDFGLSKMFRESNSERTNTFAGTADYLAPEILRNEDYSYEVDWWSFGTLVYEMIAGMTPFWAENHSVMYQRVLEDKLEFPDEMPFEARLMLEGLLERVPSRRLGYGPRGGHDMKTHAFFKGVSWDDVYHKRLEVPYVPMVRSNMDLSNFEDCFTSMSPRLSPATHDLSSSLQQYFSGYSWAPTAPIGSLSRSMLATSLASSLCGSSHMSVSNASLASRYGASVASHFQNQHVQHRESNNSVIPSAAEPLSPLVHDMDMDTESVDQVPLHHLHEDEIDLDLTPTPSPELSSNAALTLTFSRVKKPPNTPAGTKVTGTSGSNLQSMPPSSSSSLSSPSPSRPATPTPQLFVTAPVPPASGTGLSALSAAIPSSGAAAGPVARLARSNSGAGSHYWQMFTHKPL